MDGASFTCGAALMAISYIYFSNVLPSIVDTGSAAGLTEEAQVYTFLMYLVFTAGLLLVQFAALPDVLAAGRREEVEGRKVGGGGAAEGEPAEPAEGYGKEDQ